MSQERITPRGETKDLNLHVLARIRAEEVIKLLHWRKNEQLKSPYISPVPSLPLLSIKRPFEEVIAQRHGTSNSKPHDKDLTTATDLFSNLAIGAENEASISRTVSLEYDFSRALSQGEWALTDIKAAGFRPSFYDGKSNLQENPRHIEGIDLNSVVKIHNGKVVSRGFTSSWFDLREQIEPGKVSRGNAAPKTVEQVMAIYTKLAAMKKTSSAVECLVLRAQSSKREWELIAMVYASGEIPRTALDSKIHAGRKRRLHEEAKKSAYLANQLGVDRLTNQEKMVVRDAIEKARGITDFGDAVQLAGFLEILMQIERLRTLSSGALAFLLSKWFKDVWSGMGDEGVPNKSVGLGLNGRPI